MTHWERAREAITVKKLNDYNEGRGNKCFLGKKLEIKAKEEVKNRQVSPAWDKESSQGVVNNQFRFLRTFTEV